MNIFWINKWTRKCLTIWSMSPSPNYSPSLWEVPHLQIVKSFRFLNHSKEVSWSFGGENFKWLLQIHSILTQPPPLNVKSSWIGHQSSMSRSSTLLQRTPDSHSMENSCSAHTDRIQKKTKEKKITLGSMPGQRRCPHGEHKKAYTLLICSKSTTVPRKRYSNVYTHWTIHTVPHKGEQPASQTNTR